MAVGVASAATGALVASTAGAVVGAAAGAQAASTTPAAPVAETSKNSRRVNFLVPIFQFLQIQISKIIGTDIIGDGRL
jgi:hypothetical protein